MSREAVRFFMGMVGGSRSERRPVAEALAEAEEWAKREGYTFEWEPESDSWEDFLGDEDPKDVAEVLQVGMVDAYGEPAGSLGGVVIGRDDDADDVKRLSAAELALDEWGERSGRNRMVWVEPDPDDYEEGWD